MAMALYQSHLDRLWLKVFADIFQFACHFWIMTSLLLKKFLPVATIRTMASIQQARVYHHNHTPVSAIGALFDAVCKSNFKTFSTAHSHMCLPSASILGLPIMSHDSTFCFTKIARSAISRTPGFHSKLILPFLKFAFLNLGFRDGTSRCVCEICMVEY